MVRREMWVIGVLYSCRWCLKARVCPLKCLGPRLPPSASFSLMTAHLSGFTSTRPTSCFTFGPDLNIKEVKEWDRTERKRLRGPLYL